MKTDTYYQNCLEKLTYIQNNYLKNESPKTCLDYLESQLEEIKIQLSKINSDQENLTLWEVFIRTFSKDLSRYFDSFQNYVLSLSEMKSKNLMNLRKKIVSDSRAFLNSNWGEYSSELFRTKRFIYSHIKDQNLRSKTRSSLDSMVVGMHRYVYHKYGD